LLLFKVNRFGPIRCVLETAVPLLFPLIEPENAMAEPRITEHPTEIKHVTIVSSKAFAEVESALERSLPELDMDIGAALAKGDRERAEEFAHGNPLFIFSKRDHGIILNSVGQTRRAAQYEIGNPITASSMTQYKLPAALYAPLRVLLYQNESGEGVFEYDLPSSLFGQFGDKRVTAVGRKLDAELKEALSKATN
jgi:uncharacterized protein (DUF302 family)